MNKFTKKDFIFSLVTGLITGVIAWRILLFLAGAEFYREFYGFTFSSAWLVVIVPILWIIGVNLGYFLGRWMPFFNQFGKFSAVGFTNAAVDFGTLNLLIAMSGIADGIGFTIFKTISFAVGITHSYIWNRFWVFESSQSERRGQEFIKFIVVIGISVLVNVGVATLVVNGVGPQFGLDSKAWANVGAVAGSAIALIFSFVGFRLVVFKKNSNALS